MGLCLLFLDSKEKTGVVFFLLDSKEKQSVGLFLDSKGKRNRCCVSSCWIRKGQKQRYDLLNLGMIMC